MSVSKKKFQIEARRRQVADLDAQSLTEQEIAEKLGVGQATISRDIKALKLISQQFIYDMTDFAYYYKQCIDATRLVLKKQWEIANDEGLDVVIRLNALDKIKETTILLGNYYDIAPTKYRSPTEEVFHDREFGTTRPKILRGSYLTKGSGELDPDQPVLDSEPTEMDYSNRKF